MKPIDPGSTDPFEGKRVEIVIGGPASASSGVRRRRTARAVRVPALLGVLILIGAVFGTTHKDDGPQAIKIVDSAESPSEPALPPLSEPTAWPTPSETPSAGAGAPGTDSPDVDDSPPPAAEVTLYKYKGNPVLSANGRYVGFDSWEGDGSSLGGAYLYDRETESLELVSIGKNGKPTHLTFGDVSTSGRHVALMNGGAGSYFHRDRVEARTSLVSVSTSGEPANDGPFTNGPRSVSLSADGRYVAFHSPASNLDGPDTNGREDIFVRDTVAGTTQRVSVSSSGEEADRGVTDQSGPDISGNGRYVVFSSHSSNLISEPTPLCDSVSSQDPDYTCAQIYLRDRKNGTTSIISKSSDGQFANGNSLFAVISHNGRYAAFQSYASNLSSSASDGSLRNYVHDVQTGTTTLIGAAGVQDGITVGHDSLQISPNGEMVSFLDPSGIIVRSLESGQERRLSGNCLFGCPFSGDGLLMAYTSENTIRLYDWSTGESELIVK